MEYLEYEEPKVFSTCLRPEDYNVLIDLALDTKDFAWAEYLVNRQKTTKKFLKRYRKDGIHRCMLSKTGDLKFFCAGCDKVHTINVANYAWNANLDFPTIGSSMIFKGQGANMCHCAIKDGRIFYFKETYHGLKGKWMKLSEIY